MIKRFANISLLILGLILLYATSASSALNAGEDGPLLFQILTYLIPISLIVLAVTLLHKNNAKLSLYGGAYVIFLGLAFSVVVYIDSTSSPETELNPDSLIFLLTFFLLTPIFLGSILITKRNA